MSVDEFVSQITTPNSPFEPEPNNRRVQFSPEKRKGKLSLDAKMEAARTVAKFEDGDDLHDDRLDLSLGLPGCGTANKRAANEEAGDHDSRSAAKCARSDGGELAPPAKPVVGWPPIRSYRKNNLQPPVKKSSAESDGCGANFVKVSVDGAPYLRKIDLRVYKSYPELIKALESLFQLAIGKNSGLSS